MPRRARAIEGGLVYHVLNRANGRATLFRKPADFAAFERVLEEALERVPLRLLAYCLMPNHWHLVLWPRLDQGRAVSEFLRWLTVTHTQRWHAHHHSAGSGHLYQGRFKSFPCQNDEHLLAMCRYVERNPLRANLVEQAQAWPYGSLSRWSGGDPERRSLLSDWPIERPKDWLARVNRPQSGKEEEAISRSIRRSRPLGSDLWVGRTSKRLGLEWTLRPRGRPRKTEGEAKQ